MRGPGCPRRGGWELLCSLTRADSETLSFVSRLFNGGYLAWAPVGVLTPQEWAKTLKQDFSFSLCFRQARLTAQHGKQDG